MKRKPLLLAVVLALSLWAILPALAASVSPVKVVGSSNCASVNSTGDFSLKIEPVVNGTFSGPGDVQIEIILDSKQPNTFGFVINGGLVHDVIVKGAAANHYDYAASEGGPTEADFGLTIPNGNSLKHAIFCYDQVEAPTFSISGTKFEDANGNGEQDEGELGLEGWTIELDGEATTVTGEGGAYSFEGVSAGEHTACEVLKDGWMQTYPSEDSCHTVVVSEGNVSGIDFGNQFQGVAIGCGGSVGAEGEGSFATFTRPDDGSCDDLATKSAFVAVDSGGDGAGDEVVVFIPRGDTPVNFEGEILFTRAFDDPNLLVLQYDPDAEGPEDFRDMPACDVAEGGGEVTVSQVGSLIIPEGHTWCFFGVEADPIGPGFWEVRWQVFGTEDPKFR